MKYVDFGTYLSAKNKVLRGVEFKEKTTLNGNIIYKVYFAESGDNFYEITNTETGITEFWSTKHSHSRCYNPISESTNESSTEPSVKPQRKKGRQKKNYIEIQKNTETFAQFITACLRALRKMPLYEDGYSELFETAIREMKEVQAGQRREYLSEENYEDSRHFSLVRSNKWQEGIHHYSDPEGSYNFILEYDYDPWGNEGFGYFYCEDGVIKKLMEKEEAGAVN